MLRSGLAVFLMFVGLLVECRAGEKLFALNDEDTPEVVRQEKARGLVRAWGFAGVDVASHFILNEQQDLERVQQALENVIAKSQAGGEKSTSEGLSVAAEHYLVWAMVRAHLLNSPDYGEEAIERFYRVNPCKYPCEPSARVFELVVPATYLNSVGTTEILEEIRGKINSEQFEPLAVAYADRLGGGHLARLRNVKLHEAGEPRFKLYHRAEQDGGQGGPFKVEDGYLFVKVYGLAVSEDDCFSYYRAQVIEDYSREWLKKLYSDALSSATAQLKPDVRPFSDSSAPTDVAFVVEGHQVSFNKAREMLPFLQGDQRDPRFWHSIQRQALEVELIYHGELGQQLRENEEFLTMRASVEEIVKAHKTMQTRAQDEINTRSINAWFEENHDRYAKVSHVTYTVYSCGTENSTTDSTTRCAGMLEKLRIEGKDTALFATAVKNMVTSQPWTILPRETQAAIQSLKPGEWSWVFMHDGRPKLIYLHSRVIEKAQVNDVWNEVASEFQVVWRARYWEEFFGVKFNN